MYKPEVYIEGQRLDLFDDEDISVISSVQNIEDISRIFNDFSQSFTVPASKTNNSVFKHYYNASVTSGFDARIRHVAHIDINGVPFKRGTIRLESCKIENNKPAHYTITFFGQLMDLKEVIGDDYLSALDLSAYDIAYSSDNVVTGIVSGYSAQDYVFPLISTERQWFYNSNVGVITYEDKLANIAWNGSGTDHGFSWTSLRPALLIMRIIEAIELKYGITLSRDFLDSDVFDDLYLWMANADSQEALIEKTRVVNYSPWNTYQPYIGSFDNVTGAYSVTNDGADNLREVRIRVDSSDGVAYTVQVMNNQQVLFEKSGNGDIDINHGLPTGVAFNSAIYIRILTTASKTIDDLNFRIVEFSDDTVLFAEKGSFSISGTTAQVVDFIPKIKVMDFLKSIIKMYNLVFVPNSATDFYVNTLDNWYAEGQTYDISAFVDTSEVTVKRSKIYREVSFAYQEAQTILAEQYSKTNNSPYGDLETKLKNLDGTPLDGGEFEIEIDFEQMLYEKLIDLNTDDETNVVYGLCLNGGLSKTTPDPHILYIVQTDVSGNPLSIVQDDGTKAQLNGNVFMPSHVNASTMDYATTFGSEVNEHTGGVLTNSLFQLYYKDYIQDTFSVQRRMYSLKTKFPLWLLNALKLNDKLVIGADRYIINQMTTNVRTQEVEMELLNDIYNTVSDIQVQEELPPNQTEEEPDPPNESIGVSFSIANLGELTRSLGCTRSPNTTKYVSITVPALGQPILGARVYNDINIYTSTYFDGENKYYKIADNKVIRIDSGGTITDIWEC